eukprot:9326084-Pyramimonas_sp.AAC.1
MRWTSTPRVDGGDLHHDGGCVFGQPGLLHLPRAHLRPVDGAAAARQLPARHHLVPVRRAAAPPPARQAVRQPP